MRRAGLGASPAPIAERVTVLQQQINRFATPAGRVVLAGPMPSVPVTGVLDYHTAQMACVILAKRAKDAFAMFGGVGDYWQIWQDASKRVPIPLPWVADNLEEVITIVSLLADNHKLAPVGGTFGRLVSDWRVWAAAGVIGAVYLMRQRRGRR